MKIKKCVISNLEKCYSVAPLTYQGKNHILVAAEKHAPCYLFDEEGNREKTVWTEPGGVMSMVQVPESDGVFLATHKFYSPNDSKDAKIVIVSPTPEGNWEIRTLAELPHVHRFDIVTRNGVRYLIACTLKSGHKYKDDWSMLGKVYATVLPGELSGFDAEHPLKLTVVKDHMLKNHGYYKIRENGIERCIISCEEGVYRFTPPAKEGKAWEVELLLAEPASDALLLDLDQDGEKELVMISPFHGNSVLIYKKVDGEYQKVYDYSSAEFAHAIYGGTLLGEPAVIIGHRKGTRSLLLFTYDRSREDYQVKVLDEDCGPANVLKYECFGQERLIATNREIDEVAMYTFEK